jgi:hypothetical protein
MGKNQLKSQVEYQMVKEFAREVHQMGLASFLVQVYDSDSAYYEILKHLASKDWKSFDEAWAAWDTKLRRYLDGDS